MLYAGIAIVVIWIVGLFLSPITITRAWTFSENARNYPNLILMKSSSGAAIWAQELWEAIDAWRWLPLHPILIILGRICPPIAFYERRRELMGHEIEVWAEQMLKGGRHDLYREREAQALAQYRAFDGWMILKIEKEMADRAVAAMKFVTKNEQSIRDRAT